MKRLKALSRWPVQIKKLIKTDPPPNKPLASRSTPAKGPKTAPRGVSPRRLRLSVAVSRPLPGLRHVDP